MHAPEMTVTRTTVEKILSGSSAIGYGSLLDSCILATLDARDDARTEARQVVREAIKAAPAARKARTSKASSKPSKAAPAKRQKPTESSLFIQTIYKRESDVAAEYSEAVAEPGTSDDCIYEIGEKLVHCGTSYIVRWIGSDKKTGAPRLGLSQFQTGKIQLFVAQDDISETTPDNLPTVKRGDSVEYTSKKGDTKRYIVGSVRGTRVYLKFCSSKRKGFWTDLANVKPVATPKASRRGVCVVCGSPSCGIGPFSLS